MAQIGYLSLSLPHPVLCVCAVSCKLYMSHIYTRGVRYTKVTIRYVPLFLSHGSVCFFGSVFIISILLKKCILVSIIKLYQTFALHKKNTSNTIQDELPVVLITKHQDKTRHSDSRHSDNYHTQSV